MIPCNSTRPRSDLLIGIRHIFHHVFAEDFYQTCWKRSSCDVMKELPYCDSVAGSLHHPLASRNLPCKLAHAVHKLNNSRALQRLQLELPLERARTGDGALCLLLSDTREDNRSRSWDPFGFGFCVSLRAPYIPRLPSPLFFTSTAHHILVPVNAEHEPCRSLVAFLTTTAKKGRHRLPCVH